MTPATPDFIRGAWSALKAASDGEVWIGKPATPEFFRGG